MEKLKDNSPEIKNTLSILITQDGFSFCVLSTKKEIIGYEKVIISKTSNYAKELLLKLQNKIHADFAKTNKISLVTLTYENDTFSLVPQVFFDSTKLSHYIKYSTPILANDFFAFDILKNLSLANVYIPYVHINNYLHEVFGEFEYQHHLSLLMESFYNKENNIELCFAVITRNYLNFICFKNEQLILCNAYAYETLEDVAYYILFGLEQLGLNREELRLSLTLSNENELLLQYLSPYVKTINKISLSDYLKSEIVKSEILTHQDIDELLLLNL